MSDRFRVLVGNRGTTARQTTMKAAIDWSWDLLTPWEQRALAACSVFEGGFTLRAAEAVLDLSECADAPPVMDVIESLIDKSLLRVWMPAIGVRPDLDEPHFGMYISIHEYAADKLDSRGPDARRVAEERHGRYFASLGFGAIVRTFDRKRGNSASAHARPGTGQPRRCLSPCGRARRCRDNGFDLSRGLGSARGSRSDGGRDRAGFPVAEADVE